MNFPKSPLSYLILSLLALRPALARANPDAIVVVGTSPGTLSLEQLQNIYFQNGGRLPNGEAAVPLDYREGNEVREAFYRRAFKRSWAQMKAYWAARIFTGKGYPPRAVDDAAEGLKLMEKEGKAEGFLFYVRESEAGTKFPILLRLPQ